MRNVRKTVTCLGLLVVGAMWQAAGCSSNADDCTKTNICADGVDGGRDDGGGPPPPPPGCEKSPSDPSGDVLRDECGYFVSKTLVAADADGSMAKPFNTIDEALKAGMKARIYVCADGDYAERLDVQAWISIFGGIDCANGGWKYSGMTKSRINPAAPVDATGLQASVRISGGGSSTFEDLDITAADATFPGGSSIAAIVDQTQVSFLRSELHAGNGAKGDDGAPHMDTAAPGAKGEAGTDACVLPSGVKGGAGGTSTCDDGMTSGGAGGKGGIAAADTAGNGLDGTPTIFGFGLGGAGAGGSCVYGSNGAEGMAGTFGPGGSGNGTIAEFGYAGIEGQPGTIGGRGQGGGGGGGSKAGNYCQVGGSTVEGPGASGGGGGAGGCGGKGGNPGKAGGSSIALVSLNATVTLTSTTLFKGNGGNGGNGNTGQGGGAGGGIGVGGAKGPLAGSKAGCEGGKGGFGGDGGPGGGGTGGHSIGIAYVGTMPTGGDVIQQGTPGLGGAAGPGGPIEGNGAMGQSVKALQF